MSETYSYSIQGFEQRVALNHAVVGHAAQNLVVGLGEATQVAQRPCAESPLRVCVRSGARRVRAHDLAVTARPEESEEPREVFAEALLAADEDEFPRFFHQRRLS